MKKLLYMGLSALMMLLALMGVGKAQTVTFSPDPNDGAVTAGTTITISVSGLSSDETVYYNEYASLTEAQNDTKWNDPDNYDAFFAFDSRPSFAIKANNPVIRVGILNGDTWAWVKTDIYAEYTIASSGPSVTFSPAPNAGAVTAGTTITISVSGLSSDETVYYNEYASLTEAQNDTKWNDPDNYDAFFAFDSRPSFAIKANNPVIRVGILNGDTWAWVKTDIYAEYTIAGSGPSVTFSPAPNAGAVTAGTTITISVSGLSSDETVYYNEYASLTEAQNDTKWNDPDNYDAFFAFDSRPSFAIKANNPVIRVGILNGDTWAWVKTDIYAEYTIAGGETPEQPTTPTVSLTFSPASGSEVPDGKFIAISKTTNDAVYYKLYASLEAAKADDATWADKTNLTLYSNQTAPKITANNTVIKAAAWLTDKWDVFSYAEYTIKVEETVPDYTLAFDPDNDNNVEAGQFITINATPELTNTFSIYYQFYASIEAANAATWEEGSLWPTDIEIYINYDRPQITSEKPVLRAGVLNKTTKTWVASSKTIKAYTIGQTREPFVISFDPEADEEVDANTSVTLSTTPALSEGFKLYYEMFASESEAKGKTWAATTADAPSLGSMTEYTAARKPIITEEKPVVRAAVWNASTYLWESDTVVTYTVKQVEKPIVLTFTPASGAEVEEGDTVKIECSDEETVVYFMMFDTKAHAESISDEDWMDSMIEYGEPIEDEEDLGYPVITKEKPVIKAGYGIMDEEENITWNFTYAVYTVKEGETPNPDKVAAPVFTPEAGEVDSNTVVTIAKGTADSIFVAFGKTVAEAVAFAKYTADVTVTIVKDTLIRAYAMKDGKYSDTIDRAYTLKPAATVQDTVKTPTFSVEGEVEKGTKVTIACATTGAKIYYTVNGDVPTAQSTEYTAQIVIDSAMTIKAIAIKEGMVNSKMAEASYTVKPVANEGAELADVRLYPNPNKGEFNVSVPVRVQVEVFTVNGTLVKAMTLGQGNTQLRLENSGIYFVRFTAENGQAAVKRVIVR